MEGSRIPHDTSAPTIHAFAEAIVDTIREPLLVLDGALRVVVASPAFYRTFRVSREETEGTFVYDLGNAQWDIPALRTLLEEILSESIQFHDYEVEHEFEDIGRRSMLLNARRLERDRDLTQMILLAIEDVTERKEEGRAQEIAREEAARDRLERVLQETPAAMAIMRGPEPVFESVNDMYRRVFGERDYVGRSARDAVPETEAQGFLAIADQVFRTGEPYVASESRLLWDRDRDGTSHEGFFNFVYQPLTDPDGEVSGVLVHAVEVTDQVRAREEAERAYEKAKDASQAKSDFLAVISHELRTPLNAVIAYADLLLMGVPNPIPGSSKEHVHHIRANSEHLLQLIDDVITFSRVEAGREKVHLQRTDLRELAADAAKVVEPLAQKKGVTLKFQVPEEPEEMQTDPAKVRQILLNLLTNSVKFTESGEVALSAAVEGGMVTLRVKDTGIGIAPENLEHIFVPFWQVEQATKRRGGGTGLGLGVARQLAELLGGSVSVKSVPGEGSTFTVRLPRESSTPPALDARWRTRGT